jgi:hypothetical protein
MVKIDKTETIKELNDAVRGGAVYNQHSFKVADEVVPVFNINPKDYKNANWSNSGNYGSSGNNTLLITPAAITGRTYYLTHAYFSMAKDVACDNTVTNITVTTEGIARTIVAFPCITLTAQNFVVSCDFKNPIKLDSASTVIVNGTHAAGVMSRCVFVSGYWIDEN